jgi:hypothetical protein
VFPSYASQRRWNTKNTKDYEGHDGGESISFKKFIMEIQLVRKYYNNGTNGVLTVDGVKICDTIELPWRDNKFQVSCIPEGRYRIRPRYTMRFGWHCTVDNVPGRTAILVHAFNNALKESQGCIAPVTTIEGEGRGSQSRPALKRLMELLFPGSASSKSHYLTIKKSDHEYSNQKGAKKNA